MSHLSMDEIEKKLGTEGKEAKENLEEIEELLDEFTSDQRRLRIKKGDSDWSTLESINRYND